MKEKDFWIWLAGFTDGEGCFSICNIRNKTKKYEYFQPIIKWANTNKNVLFFIKENAQITNKITEKRQAKKPFIKKYNQNIKTQYQLSITKRKDCLRVLNLLIPFLKIKEAQAKNMKRFILETTKNNIL